MKYIKDPHKLAGALKVLALHEPEVKNFYFSTLSPKLTGLEDAKDKLVTLFVVANSGRRGIGKSKESLINAATHFYQGIEQKIKECRGIEPQEAHEVFLKWLCNIPGMDQKTANLLLKWIVMFDTDFEFGLLDWQTWRPHLHVPLDRWVVRLMGKRHLGACTDDYERIFLETSVNPKYINLSFEKKEYHQLQKELTEVALLSQEPKIVLDVLWFVGHLFCDYHPILCDNCWIRKTCLNYKPPPDWGSIPSKSKSELRRERQEEQRRINQLIRTYMKGHPERVEEIKEKHSL